MFVGQRGLEATGEQHPVRQPGEGVVQRLSRQGVLQHLALGDVARREHDALDRGLVGEVLGGDLVLPPMVIAAEPTGDPLALGPIGAESEAGLGCLEIVRMDQIEPGRPAPIRTEMVVEEPRRRGAAEGELSGAIDHHDEVG